MRDTDGGLTMKTETLGKFDTLGSDNDPPTLIRSNVFHDSRGFFTEVTKSLVLKSSGIMSQFVQDNRSRSIPKVIRGMHAQLGPAQAKLVSCLRGSIFDVIVDIRPESATFGKFEGVTLKEDDGVSLYVPIGFAHGFCVLGDQPADVFYKVSAEWSPTSEVGVRFDDPTLKIPWPVSNPIVSEKDRKLPSFSELANFLNERHAVRAAG